MNGTDRRRGWLVALAGMLGALVVGAAWWLTSDASREPVDVVAPSVVGVDEPTGDGLRASAETPEAAPVERIDAPTDAPTDTRAASPGEADAPLVVTGRVVDPDDAAIAGATVALHPGREIDGDPALEVSTDADGRFTAELDTDAADVMLLVTADGFAPRPVALARAKWPENELDLTLRWIAGVSGRVTDAETGRPLVGARVTCGDAATTTDDAGRYRLDAIAVGRPNTLVASADGYVTATVPLHLRERRDAEVDVRIERGAEVVVVIVDAETDRPLQDIEVRAFRGAEDFVTTDATGRHTLIATDGMRASLHLSGPDHATATWNAQLRDPLPASIRIPLPRWAWIDGRVVDHTGAPVEGAKIRTSHSFRDRPAVTFDGPGTLHSSPLPSVQTDADGRFAQPVTPSVVEERTVHCAAPGLVAAPLGPFVLDTPGARIALDVTMERSGSVRGTVRMGDEVWAEGSVGWRSLRAEVSGRSRVAEDGTYELADVMPGGVELKVHRADFDRTDPLTATLEVAPGEVHERDFAWPVPVTAPITGRVTYEDGTPAAGATVRAFANGRGFVDGVTVDDDGAFTLDVGQGTTWSVSARLDDRRASVQDVAAGTTGLALVLPTLGRVRLELVDADDGTPVRSGGIFGLGGVSWRASGGDDGFRHVGASPDVDGVVELELPLSTGAIDVVVAPVGGYEPRVLDTLPVSPDDAPPAHRVELRRGLEVRLTAADGTELDLLEDHLVFLVSTDERGFVAGPFEKGDERSNWRFGGQHIFLGCPYFAERVVTLRAKDVCVISGLRPGRHEFVVMPDDVVFDPPTIDVTPGSPVHELTWTRR